MRHQRVTEQARLVQFTIWVKDEDKPDELAWAEPYTRFVRDPNEWARELLAYFNSSCRPGEPKRVLVRLVVDSNDTGLPHEWVKSNLVTIVRKGGGMFDSYRCAQCGGTSKRYGLAPVFERDPKVPEWCPGKVTAKR